MQRETVPTYEALAQDIRNAGVETVFGLMSDDTALLATTLDSIGVTFQGARHENNGVAMAVGYAAASGKLGVAIVGRGPATANALNGATYAQRSGARVLLIFGDAPVTLGSSAGFGPDGKALNSAAILQAAGLRTFTATDSQTARRTLAQALAAAEHETVALLLPTSVQFGRIDPAATHPGTFASPVQAPRPPRAAAIVAAAELLRRSRRPLVVAGVGAWRAGAREALVRLADHIGAGIATTVKAQDMFRGYDFNCGIVGSLSTAGGRRLIEQADCVVVFGASLNQRTTSFGTALPADVPVIHVERDRRNIGRWYQADVAVVGDARLAAEQLIEALASRPPSEKPLHAKEMRDWLKTFRPADNFQPAPTPRTMDPRSLAIELDGLLPQDRNIVYDAGNFFQVLPYMAVPGPSHMKFSTDSASIGLGFGTALGFACGSPGRPTVLVLGDGGFLMAMGELETAARLDIPLVVVLMNDCAYGAELHYLKLHDMPVAASIFPDVDYAPVAEAFGFQAATVRTLEELRALAPLLGKPQGTIFLDCKINAAIVAPFLLENVGNQPRAEGR